jgi:hypothetical protein
MRNVLALAGVVLAATSGLAAAAGPQTTGSAFVDTFAAVCIPERLSSAGTVAHAKKTGWTVAEPEAHPELKTVLEASDRELKAASEPDWVFRRSAFSKAVDGKTYYLVATYVHAPEVITLGGCYLYDFEATGPADFPAVTKLLGVDVGRTSPANGAMMHVWGPSEKLPRTLDTYYYEVPEGSNLAKQAGFSGHMLKFETSIETPEPAPEN